MNSKENPIAQNRAEELGYDLWDEFVIPPFYDSLDLLNAKKPRVIIGGRGCGKTSLLRYLCHQSQFSPKRHKIEPYNLHHIGLYWKIDTQFAKQLSKRGLEDEFWSKAFEHMSTLLICREVLKSLESIADSAFASFNLEDLNVFNFEILNSFNLNAPADFNGLKVFIRREFNQFQTWVGGIRTINPPIFLPKTFVNELINEVKSQNRLFIDTIFYVYIDEYENLLSEQQQLINTWVKHSEMPLIFNLAMKRNSFNDKKTIGNEQLSEIHDYREYDLESYYDGIISFESFAAEILFLRLYKYESNINIPIDIDELRDIKSTTLVKRRSEIYRKKVINAAKEYLPSFSHDEIANEVFNDNILLNRYEKTLHDALSEKRLLKYHDQLYIKDFPQAAVIIPALIHRNVSVDELLLQINKMRQGLDNKFTGKTAWIHNNLVGCILILYEPLGRICPFYSGFEAFCLMSKSNLRHFLELCFKSITNERLRNPNGKFLKISVKSQAEAAKQASTSFLKEVKSFGSNGNSLHTFVIRLGTYFKYAHKRPAQSEPEQNHFSIKGTPSPEISNFLGDAIKWSVLYENKITKQKGGKNRFESEDFEYILNPIYAPYFHISYRKKRRVDFTINQLNSILFGDYNEFEKFLKTSKGWKLTNGDTGMNLFSNFIS